MCGVGTDGVGIGCGCCLQLDGAQSAGQARMYLSSLNAKHAMVANDAYCLSRSGIRAIHRQVLDEEFPFAKTKDVSALCDHLQTKDPSGTYSFHPFSAIAEKCSDRVRARALLDQGVMTGVADVVIGVVR